MSGTKEARLKAVMSSYLVAMKNKNENELKKVVSTKYFNFMKKTKLLESSFKKQKPGKVKDFDFTFRPLALEKNAYFVNIKNKEDKFYSDYWFVIKKVNEKFLIDSSVFLD
jgi:hypothetical protein